METYRELRARQIHEVEQDARVMGIMGKLYPQRRNFRFQKRPGFCRRCDISLTGRFSNIEDYTAMYGKCGRCRKELGHAPDAHLQSPGEPLLGHGAKSGDSSAEGDSKEDVTTGGTDSLPT